MTKKMMATIMVAVFLMSAIFTVALGAPPCNRCKKDGCPPGHCYVDCVGCCYDTWNGPVCYR
ncbi:MAG TPA: hypothetical protein VHP63_03145 [candidate division Zixibacteria bacterium]|nr:hypothetical protein [candidate division Zixibacteria bacterium]